MEASYTRNCPSCKDIIKYRNEKNRDNAELTGNKCPKCRQTKKDKTKECIVCNSKFLGQGKTCSQPCRLVVIKETKQKKYGNAFYNNREKCKNTCIKKYGVDNVAKSDEIKKLVTEKVRYFSRVDVSGENNPMYGKKHSPSTKRKQRLKRIESLNNKHPLFPGYNPFACQAIDQFGKENGYEFQHAENGGEYFIKELGYWVDGYDKNKNVVIEYDEAHHFDKNGKLRGRDVERQKEIEEYLQCTFLRIKQE